MKRRIFVLALTPLLFLGLGLSATFGSYVNYLGKTTWTATITDSTKPDRLNTTYNLTGGISKVGDEFYLFQGYVTQGTDGPYVVSGSGALVGTTLFFSLSGSQQFSDNLRCTDIMHLSLDKATLNGTFHDIGHDIDTGSRQFDERFTAGTLIRTGSPVPLSPNLAPQQLLLLE